MSIFRTALALAAAAFLAAALLAPSAAEAHPQHLHTSSPHAHSHSHAAPTAEHVSAPQELTSAQVIPADVPAKDACADRGCCSNGSCTACCSIVAPVLAVSFPSPASSLVLARDGPVRTPPAVEGPSRPPKHFA